MRTNLFLKRRSFLLATTSIALVGCADSAKPGETVERTAEPGEPGMRPNEIETLTADELAEAEAILWQFSEDPRDSGPSLNQAAITAELSSVASVLKTARKEISESSDRYFDWQSDDANSFDLYHLTAFGDEVECEDGSSVATAFDDREFELTPALLRRMMRTNSFGHALNSAPDASDGRVIVALRGCAIVGDFRSFTASVILKEHVPDMRTEGCVFLVWKRTASVETDEVAAFPGSTVPSELYKAIYQNWVKKPFGTKSYRANMMPQGLHWKRLNSMPENGGKYPYVLRQDSLTPVVRERIEDQYSLDTSEWDPETPNGTVDNVNDHLHLSVFNPVRKWNYSSQGCQTISGTLDGDPKKVTGEIVRFFSAMNFVDPLSDQFESPVPTNWVYTPKRENGVFTGRKYGVRYPFVLLSGREARLHADGALEKEMMRVRIGSSVDIGDGQNQDHPVIQVEQALDQNADGKFDEIDMLHLIRRQQQTGNVHKADGVFSPRMAKLLDIQLQPE